MEIRPAHRQTGDRDRLASQRLPSLLVVEESPSPGGRPAVAAEVRELIRGMSVANPGWGAPRIHGELGKLGITVSETTVAKYMVRVRRPPSQTWRAFLSNHIGNLVTVDFFLVPTATFRLLFVFVILAHDRRRPIHFAVTRLPTAEWTAQQLVQAFPWDRGLRFLLRDRDGTYGSAFRQTAAGLGIEEVLCAPRSPWQNAYAERLIGSIRRECVDHVIVFNESGLRRILRAYFEYHPLAHSSVTRQGHTESSRRSTAGTGCSGGAA
jgi:transposase InsO family protein